MKHFDHCQCAQCRSKQPPRTENPCGFLMQQIIAQGRNQLHCQRFCLSLSPLPRILVPPYTIRDVQLCGEIAIARDTNTCGCAQNLSATIPLSVLVCDSTGNTHTALSHITVPVAMRHATHGGNSCQYLAQAEVQLCQQPVCFEDPAQVPVCLNVCIQVYGVRFTAMLTPTPCPACPLPLPLYPQPCRR